MQANFLTNILTSQKVDAGGPKLLSGKKINSGEAELFAKLLQGSIVNPEMTEVIKKGEGLNSGLVKEMDSPKLQMLDLESDKKQALLDNQNIIELLSRGAGDQVASVNPSLVMDSESEIGQIIASNPRLLDVFEKTEKPRELIVRLRDLMIRDPKIAKDVEKLLKQVEQGEKHSLNLIRLGKQLANTEVLPLNPLRIQSNKIAEYGQNQLITERRLITPKKEALPRSEKISFGETVQAKVLPFMDRVANNQSSVHAVSHGAKVLDMSAFSATSGNELINKISEYVQQSNLQNRQSLELTVRHDDLGNFRINVSKLKGGDHLDLQITTTTKEGRNFFAHHESRLIHSLEMNGVKLADMRITGGQEFARMDSEGKGSQSDQNLSQNNGRGASQYSMDRDSADADSRRRRDLWEMFKERNAA